MILQEGSLGRENLCNRIIRYSYDNSGNLSTVTDALEHKIVHSHDELNRLLKTEYYLSSTDTVPTKTITYSYNKVGSLTGYDDLVTSATYAYDDLQRRTGETVNYGSFSLSQSYSYYANSFKKSYTDPAGRSRTWSYDLAGRPTGINLGSAGEVSTNSFTWNSPTKITLPGGSSLNLSYNGLQQLTDLVAKNPAQNPVIDYSYIYDLDGQVTDKATEHGSYSYDYNAANRLTSAHNPSETEEYSCCVVRPAVQ